MPTEEFLQSQEILRRCFINVENRLSGGFNSTQDYFNAVYDETKDALRIGFGSGAGFLYWGEPVELVGDLPGTGLTYEVRFVNDDGSGNHALYVFNGSTWEEVISAGSSLEVQDEGITVQTEVTKINFIGASVQAVEGVDRVDIYIPTVGYVSHFNTSDGTTDATVTTDTLPTRYVAAPTSEGTPYKIGDWIAGTTHATKTGVAIGDVILSYTTNNPCSFADNTSTTVEVNVYDADGVTVLATRTTPAITADVDDTVSNIRVKVSGFATNMDKNQAVVLVEFTLNGIIASGGRFSVEMIHHNGSEGDYTRTHNNLFFDSDAGTGSITSVAIAETAGQVVTVRKSGVEEYTTGSEFTVDIDGIDSVNANSYTDDLVQATAAAYGLAALDLGSGDLTGWANPWDDVATYQNTAWAIGVSDYFSRSTTAKARADTVDPVATAFVESASQSIIVDTYLDDSTRVYEDFTGETLRLESDLVSSWDNTASLLLTDSGTGLQVGEGTYLLYPSLNYGVYYPNPGTQFNYSTATGTKYYYRKMWHTGVSHPNGTFNIVGVAEADLTSDDVVIEISLNGTSWFNCNEPYLGGALSNGDGCRTNADTITIPTLEFTFGTGVFTSVSTGGGWGIYLRISMPSTSTVQMDKIEITDWV